MAKEVENKDSSSDTELTKDFLSQMGKISTYLKISTEEETEEIGNKM